MATLYGGAERERRTFERRHAVTPRPLARSSFRRKPGSPAAVPDCSEIPAFAGMTRILEIRRLTMTDALVNDTRKAELLSNEVEHIDIKSFDARPIVDAMKKMSFTSRDLGRADRHLQPDARRPGLLDLPGDRRLDLGRRLHGPLCRAGAQQHGRRDRRHRRHHRRHGFLRRRSATSIIRRSKSPTTTRCARSTSTASTTPISTRSSSRTSITRSARSPNSLEPKAYSLARLHPRDGQVADRARQEGEQPGQARLRA